SLTVLFAFLMPTRHFMTSRMGKNILPIFPWLLALLPGLAIWLMAIQVPAADQTRVDFARDIQPIFIKRCYECHGPDKQKHDLRLDRKAEALKGGKSGKPLLLPGKNAESEIIARVTSKDPDELMPAKGEPLTAEQIALLRAWIDQ